MIQRLRCFLKSFHFLRALYRRIRYPHGLPKGPDPAEGWEIREVTDFRPRKTARFGDGVRLNLLVPTVLQGRIFGGIATAVRLFDALCDETGAARRIIATDMVDLDGDTRSFASYATHPAWQDSDDKEQILPYSWKERLGGIFPVGRNDVFIATAWQTAYNILPVLNWQAEAYGVPRRRLVYLIQDFEPGFYPWGSRYLMAESTYTQQVPILAVFNSGLLRDYFHRQGYRFFREACFEPTLNPSLRAWLEAHPTLQKKKQILLYGRPGVERNCFSLVATAVQEWARVFPGAREWQVVAAGEEFRDIEVAGGVAIHCAGKLSLEAYAAMLADSYLGISIMASPHPSYPPLEMSSFGVKAITNCFANKNLAGFNDNLVSLPRCSPRDIAAEMARLCAVYTPEAHIGRNEAYFADGAAFSDICGTLAPDLLEGL